MSKSYTVRAYRVRVKHDAGIINITTWATSKTAAARSVMAAERCPARAILKVREA